MGERLFFEFSRIKIDDEFIYFQLYSDTTMRTDRLPKSGRLILMPCVLKIINNGGKFVELCSTRGNPSVFYDYGNAWVLRIGDRFFYKKVTAETKVWNIFFKDQIEERDLASLVMEDK